jgi:N-6 DNA Methylase
MSESASLTAADIARLAGVTRATVSNWRRRHADFPAPTRGTDASPAYDRAMVESWLAARGALPKPPPQEQLWRVVTEAAVDDENLSKVVQDVAASLMMHAAIGLPGALKTDISENGRSAVGADHPDTRLYTAAAKAVREMGAVAAVRALIDRYAESAGISVTPKPVADLMTELAGVFGGTVLDPACGTGELLIAALDRGASKVRGQELDKGLCALADAFTSVWLQPWQAGQGTDAPGPKALPGGSPAEAVLNGDSLLADGYSGVEADAVVCHPPFGSRDWGQEQLASDPRWVYGIPPRSEPELAWAQHALAHLRPGGRAVLLMPPAAASRPSGRRIRAELLRRAALRAVIAMPPGAVRPMHVPLHLWVLEHPVGTAPADPRVLLVDVSGRERVSQDNEGNAARTGEEDGGFPASLAATVLNAWQVFTASAGREHATGREKDAKPGRWQVMRAIDLLDEAVDLTPARHVAPAESGLPPEQASLRLRELRDRFRAALAEFECLLQREDWITCEAVPQWRTVPVTDLVRTRMLEYLRERRDGPVTVRPGDVLIPAWLAGGVSEMAGPRGTGEPRATVAGDDEAGTRLGQHRSLLRPDPSQVDAWFVAGFAMAPGSVRQASYGTSAIRIDARRLEVPLLPLDQQRRYGAAFRRLHDAERAAAHVAGLTGELAALLADGMSDGTLLPRSPVKDGAGVDSGEEEAVRDS